MDRNVIIFTHFYGTRLHNTRTESCKFKHLKIRYFLHFERAFYDTRVSRVYTVNVREDLTYICFERTCKCYCRCVGTTATERRDIAEVIRTFGAMLGELCSIPIEYFDERMTTVIAYRYMSATETYGKKRRDSVDTLSAEIILQDYLDAERAGRV